MIYDFHTHSTASDGILSPTELIQRAADKNVDYLALTDHDTVSGLEEAEKAATDTGIHLVNGIELSAKWEFYEIHIIGLNIDPQNKKLLKGIESQQFARKERLSRMADKLIESGIKEAEELTDAFKRGDHIGRPTVANFLVNNGISKDYKEAYSRINRGGDLYVEPNWERLQYVISWIKDSGGVAVLAHPGSYGLDKNGFNGIVSNFNKHGGQALEVCYGPCSKAAISRWGHFARKYSLYGSIGSDFHRPTRGIELGRLNSLPKGVEGVWNLFLGS